MKNASLIYVITIIVVFSIATIVDVGEITFRSKSVISFAGNIKGLQSTFHVNRIYITLGGNVSICHFFITLKFKIVIQIFSYNCEKVYEMVTYTLRGNVFL